MSLLFATLMGVGIAAMVFTLLSMFSVARSAVPAHEFNADAASSGNLRSLIAAQRTASGRARTSGEDLAILAALETAKQKNLGMEHGRLTLERRLKYAKWRITPGQFRAIQLAVTLVTFLAAYILFRVPLQILALCLPPLLVEEVLNMAVHKRFFAFDRDYPVMLMQYVSLLKTGMTAVTGLKATAEALDKGSLVRAETELLVERLRLGLNEEQAINAYGEDIAHPELELFVQSLLLHQRVGGSLSSTLERLAKQVRKRQQFRQQAVAAVAMERTSIMAIAFVMTGLMMYMYLQAPELVEPAFSHQTGMLVFQSGFALILFGFYWSTQVTKVKV